MIDEEKANEFIEEIEAVCRKFGISISHEDSQGGFKLVPFDDDYMEWFKDASVNGKWRRSENP